MLEFTKMKSLCTGCSACYAACPIGCITMQQDEEGFLYPVASDACIQCGKCEKVCPIQNPIISKSGTRQEAYAAVTKNDAVWRQSSSGGAFSEICQAWDDGGVCVAGAAWDDNFRVHHICVKGVQQIAPLRKSKYISSDLEDTFCKLKDHLRAGGKAVFCGTPCQVAGLRAYLGKDYANLLLIDLICHGVGSPSVFISCMENIGRELGVVVAEYEFRAKRRIHETDYLTKIVPADGSAAIYMKNDRYIQLFLSQCALRPSCGNNCRFRSTERQGDLTIADFKGLHKVFPDLVGSKRNYSSVIVNTEKGAMVAEKLKQSMEMRLCSVDVICNYNPLFCSQTAIPNERDSFFADFIKDPTSAIDQWTVPGHLCPRTIKSVLHEILPVPVRKMIINLLRK